jgi:hypothetical protein
MIPTEPASQAAPSEKRPILAAFSNEWLYRDAFRVDAIHPEKQLSLLA